MGEMGFDSGGDEGNGVAALLTAGFDHRQHGLDEPTAARALRSKRQLPPNHRVTQRTFARVVRRFDPFVMQKRPKPRAMLVQLPTRAAHVASVALHSRSRERARPFGEPDPSDAQGSPRNPARAILGPVLGQLARRNVSMGLRQLRYEISVAR